MKKATAQAMTSLLGGEQLALIEPTIQPI